MVKNKFDSAAIIRRAVKRFTFYITKANELFILDKQHPENGALPATFTNMDQLIAAMVPDPLSKAQMEGLRGKLREAANKRAIQQEVYTRIGFNDGADYLDLGRPGVVEITAKKVRVVTECPALFYKPKAMGDLPLPDLSSDAPLKDIRLWLIELLNLDPYDIKLVLAWLLFPFCEMGTRPILVIEGPQRSAKTSNSRFIIRLVDGHQPPMVGLPTTQKDLFVSANGRIAVAYDNVSDMRGNISDNICQIASGGAFITKKLYTDGEEFVITAYASVLVNGITTGTTRGDFLDRSLRVHAPRLTPQASKTEAELETLFQKNHPRILGAIVRLVQYALKNPCNLPEDLRLSRLVDFCQWSYSWAPAVGMQPEKLVGHINENQEKAKLETLSEDSVAAIIVALLDDSGGLWEGSSTELFDEFMDNAASRNLKYAERLTSPQALTNRLIRAAPALTAAGIEFSKRHGNKGTIITIRRHTTT